MRVRVTIMAAVVGLGVVGCASAGDQPVGTSQSSAGTAGPSSNWNWSAISGVAFGVGAVAAALLAL
jgi:hypothetical protein